MSTPPSMANHKPTQHPRPILRQIMRPTFLPSGSSRSRTIPAVPPPAYNPWIDMPFAQESLENIPLPHDGSTAVRASSSVSTAAEDTPLPVYEPSPLFPNYNAGSKSSPPPLPAIAAVARDLEAQAHANNIVQQDERRRLQQQRQGTKRVWMTVAMFLFVVIAGIAGWILILRSAASEDPSYGSEGTELKRSRWWVS